MKNAFSPKRALYLGLFEYWRTDPRFVKALSKRGIETRYVDYRQLARQLAPWGLNKKFGRGRMVARVAEIIRDFKPELVWIGKGEMFTAQDLLRFKESNPGVKIILWYGEPPEEAHVLFPLCPHLDGVFLTHAGEQLNDYVKAGAALAAFTPNPCDPELQFPRTPLPDQRHPVLFTGVDIGDERRRELVGALQKQYGEKFGLYGWPGTPKIRGVDYYQVLSGAQATLSLSRNTEAVWYHSDRLTDSMACGAPTVVLYGAGMEALFTQNEHCLWGRSNEELLAAVDRLLNDTALQSHLRYHGMRHIYQISHQEKVTRAVLETLEGGEADVEWNTVRLRGN